MIKNMQPIKNPLTIIGIFASLIEVSGNCILPILNERCQFYYMWFLMGFPPLLVTYFFIVLWFKPRSLYAPSDFQDENNFLKCIFPAATQDMTEQKVQDLALEKAVEIECQLNSNQADDQKNSSFADNSINKNFSQHNRLQKYRTIEKAVFDYVSHQYNANITQEIGIQGKYEKIFLDGYFCKNNQRYFLEIKYVSRLVLIQQHIDRIIGRFMRANVISANDILLLIFVYDGEVIDIQNRIRIPENLPFNLEIKYLKEDELNLDNNG